MTICRCMIQIERSCWTAFNARLWLRRGSLGQRPEGMNGIDFCAVDVETANSDRSSICQIGLVTVRGGQVVDRWESLVDPQAPFVFTDIHGIDEAVVAGQPTLPNVWNELCAAVGRSRGGSVLVSHTPFDRTAFQQAWKRHRLPPLPVRWLDSARVARQAWPQRYRRRWSLKLIADDLGIEFRHHDALEDAEAAARIVIQASAAMGFRIQDWLDERR